MATVLRRVPILGREMKTVCCLYRWWLAAGIFGLLSCAVVRPAVAGDKPADLVAQGNDFRSNGQMTEALWAYRQAAKAGSVKGALAAGDLLFQEAKTETGRKQVLDFSEALNHLFVAATNQQSQACADLSEALQNGLGVKTNLVAAYAWLAIAANGKPSLKPALDQLVVQLEPKQVLQAQQTAREYLAGQWPSRVARVIVQGDPRLKVQGVSDGPKGTLVILNGETLAAGESVNVPPANGSTHDDNGRLVVTCRKIGQDYLLVSVAGDNSLKMLRLNPR